jgi:conjugal transfer pilin signal peptidase TrbI
MQQPGLLEKFFFYLYYLPQKKLIFWPVITVALIVAIIHYTATFGVNFSDSTPNRYYIFAKHFSISSLKKDDVVMVRYENNKFYPWGTKFVKLVAGFPGDVVTSKGQNVYINGKWVGRRKVKSGKKEDGEPLEPGPEGVIPPHYYFMYTHSPHSFDSRYSYVGFVHESQIIGKNIFAWGNGPEQVAHHSKE